MASALVQTNNFSKGIVVKPTQGFGNRLRMMASTYILSKYLDVPFFIMWEIEPDCKIAYNDIFNNKCFQTVTMTELVNYKYLYHGLIHTDMFVNNLKNADKMDYLVITGGHEFKLQDMALVDFLYYKKEFYQSLLFNTRINTLLQYNIDLLPENYIGIHIRSLCAEYDSMDMNISKKNEYNPVDFNNNSPIDSYYKYIDLLDVDIAVLVITNNPSIIDNFRRRYPHRYIYTTNPISYDRDVGGTISSIVDMLILSRSKLIIGTYFSSFSDVASSFNLIPKITPLSSRLYNTPNILSKYHCYNYTNIQIRNTSFYGLNLTDYHLCNYFNIV